MTKDEWLQVQETLSHPWGSVNLTVDGYALTLQVRQVKPLKYVIMVFVNGFCKGEWLKGEADEAKRFCRPVTKALHSPAKKKAMTKGMPKSFLKEHAEYLNKTWTMWELCWLSFGPLKRHLIANNKVIALAVDELDFDELDFDEALEQVEALK